jgi:nucleoid DNA-binding protein
MIFSDNLGKRQFWRYVNAKLKRAIGHYHVFAVLNILLEEMVEDLKQGKDIKIHNLGTLSLQPTKARRYFDFRFQKVMQSARGYHVLRFILADPIGKKLRSLLDMDQTFGHE